jgi:hypothetical protein
MPLRADVLKNNRRGMISLSSEKTVRCRGGQRSRVWLDICPGCAGYMSRPAGSWGGSEDNCPADYLKGKAEKQSIQRGRDSLRANDACSPVAEAGGWQDKDWGQLDLRRWRVSLHSTHPTHRFSLCSIRPTTSWLLNIRKVVENI